MTWLAEFESRQLDAWDAEIERDSQPGGRLGHVIARVRKYIEDGRTKPLDEFLDDA